MKYKILLIGNNKALIDDLFKKSSNNFEYQTTSARYEDIVSHMKYFQPDGFLYCINHELPETFLRMSELKQSPEAGKTSFFAIGTRADCNTYIRTAPDVVDLVLEKPMTLNAMEEKILIYFSSRSSAQKTSAPVKQQQTVNNTAQTPNQPQAGNNTMQANSPQAVKQAQAPGNSNAAVQIPAPGTPQPIGQAQGSGLPQPTGQAQGSGMLQETGQAPAPAPATDSPVQPKAPTNADNDLLQALTNEIGEAAKVLEAVEDMDLGETSNDAPFARKHVLVVDDDSRMLKIIKRHLADKYDVGTALNGKIALKFLESKRTDLILLDYEMPLESGPVILKKLRDNPATANIPVIFLTGISERDKIETALALKPQGYLLKPIDHIKLLSTISKFVDKTN